MLEKETQIETKGREQKSLSDHDADVLVRSYFADGIFCLYANMVHGDSQYIKCTFILLWRCKD